MQNIGQTSLVGLDLFGQVIDPKNQQKLNPLDQYDSTDFDTLNEIDADRISPLLAERMIDNNNDIFRAHRRSKIGPLGVFVDERAASLRQLNELQQEYDYVVENRRTSAVKLANLTSKRRRHANDYSEAKHQNAIAKQNQITDNSPNLFGEVNTEFIHGFDLLDGFCWVFDLYGQPSAITFIMCCNEIGRDWQIYQERIAATMRSELTDLVNFILMVRGNESAKRVVAKLSEVIDLNHLISDASKHH